MDTGASVHISPEQSYFTSINPITPHSVKDLGGTYVVAKGVSTIKLCVEKDLYIILSNVLYIQDATVRLISIWCLAQDSNTVTHFNQDSCWLTNKKKDSIIECGILLPHKPIHTHSVPLCY